MKTLRKFLTSDTGDSVRFVYSPGILGQVSLFLDVLQCTDRSLHSDNIAQDNHIEEYMGSIEMTSNLVSNISIILKRKAVYPRARLTFIENKTLGCRYIETFQHFLYQVYVYMFENLNQSQTKLNMPFEC